MTTTAPRPTAREQLAAVAAEHGWTEMGAGSTTLDVRRGGVTVQITFARGGRSVAFARVWADDRERAQVWHTDKDKRETVTSWLREAVEQGAAEPTAEQTAELCARPDHFELHPDEGGDPATTAAHVAAHERDGERARLQGEIDALRQQTEAIRAIVGADPDETTLNAVGRMARLLDHHRRISAR